MLKELDWSTPVGETVIGNHWRILLSVVIGAVLVTPIWHAFFPNTLWFTKLWTGFATGATFGMIAGTWWQLGDAKRYAITSGRFVSIATLAWGAFACISLFLWAPNLYAQERELSAIRSLKTTDILSVTICLDGQNPLHVTNARKINSHVTCTRNAELFYPSHEGSDCDRRTTKKIRLLLSQSDAIINSMVLCWGSGLAKSQGIPVLRAALCHAVLENADRLEYTTSLEFQAIFAK